MTPGGSHQHAGTPPPRLRIASVLPALACVLAAATFVLTHTIAVERHLTSLCDTYDELTGVRPGSRPILMGPFATDSHLWLRLAHEMTDRDQWRIRHTDFDNAPQGRPVHWSSPPLWWLATLARLRGDDAPPSRALSLAGIRANPILLLLALPLVTALTIRRFGSVPACVLPVALTATPAFYEGFLPAYPDHHGPVALAGLLMLLGLLGAGAGWTAPRSTTATPHGWLPASRQSAARWMALSGVAGGVGLWLSATSQIILLVGAGLGLLAAAWLLSTAKSAPRPVFDPTLLRIWARWGAGVSLLAYAIEYLPGHASMRLEVNHPLYALAWLGAAEVLALLIERGIARGQEPRRGFPVGRFALGLLALATPLLAIVLLGRTAHILHDPFMAAMHSHVLELRPVAERIAAGTLTWGGVFGLLPLLAPVAVVLLFVRRVPAEAKATIILTLGPLLVPTALQLAQTRWGLLAAPATVLLTAVLATVVWDHPGIRARPTLRTVGAAAILIPFLLVPWHAWRTDISRGFSDSHPGKPARHELRPLLQRDIAFRIADDADPHTRPVLLSTPSPSLHIAATGGLQTLGTLYWENVAGLRAAAEILAAPSDDEARARLSARGVTHIVLFPDDPYLDHYIDAIRGAPATGSSESAFGKRLLAGDHPAWITPLPMDDHPIAAVLGVTPLVVRVDPDPPPPSR